MDAFLADTRADAYERVVDRLLASPRYGERWARSWLDLVGAMLSTYGGSWDRPRSMWPYRDWVSRALNQDMPFSRFTIEQIAGDLPRVQVRWDDPPRAGVRPPGGRASPSWGSRGIGPG